MIDWVCTMNEKALLVCKIFVNTWIYRKQHVPWCTSCKSFVVQVWYGKIPGISSKLTEPLVFGGRKPCER